MKRSPILNRPKYPAPRHDQIICYDEGTVLITREDGTPPQIGDYSVNWKGQVLKKTQRGIHVKWTTVSKEEADALIYTLAEFNPVRAVKVRDLYKDYS